MNRKVIVVEDVDWIHLVY